MRYDGHLLQKAVGWVVAPVVVKAVPMVAEPGLVKVAVNIEGLPEQTGLMDAAEDAVTPLSASSWYEVPVNDLLMPALLVAVNVQVTKAFVGEAAGIVYCQVSPTVLVIAIGPAAAPLL